MKPLLPILPSLLLIVTCGVKAASAQPISATDGTGTIVISPDGRVFNITGGTQAGANLFHSFEQFGLDRGQTADFQANPSIQNILGRVVGGDASIIDGLIKVTQTNANLYLVNPTGILFGPNARLDVPGSFNATTANGIRVGDSWFKAMGANNYADLMEMPGDFAFTTARPGTIFNAGNLAVPQGESITLVGGMAINTGTLSTPEGNITIAAVEGQELVRISPEGSLLSLELPVEAVATLNADVQPLTPLALPQLLTGGNLNHATGVTVKNGVVKLTGSDLRVESGDVVGGEVTAQTATLSAEHNLTLVESQLQASGDLTLLAGDTVRIRDSVAKPFTARAGGNLYVRGNQNIDILALNHPQASLQSGGNLSLVSDGFISGDAQFSAGGSFSILDLAGEPGEFLSLEDPKIISDGDVTFGNYTGVSLWVEAAGSIAAGDITINGIDPLLSSQPFLILRAGTTVAPGEISLGQGNTQESGGTNFNSPTGILSAGSLDVGNIAINASGVGGPVVLEAAGDIEAASITSNGGEIFLNSSQGGIDTSIGILNSTAGSGDSGSISLQAEDNITTGGLNASAASGNGSNITLLSQQGAIDTSTGTVDSSSGQGNGGSVFFHAAEGSITASDLKSSSPNGAGGNITLFAESVNTANIDALGLTGGEVSLSSTNGAIDTTGGTTDADATSVKGSAVTLHALGNVTTANVEANGGQIGLTSTEGAIDTRGGTLDSASNGGAGGAVTLQALTDVTTGKITSHGGTISLISSGSNDFDFQEGNIDTRGGTLDSSSDQGEGGDITLKAFNSITTGDITSGGGQIGLSGFANLEQNINGGPEAEIISAALTSDIDTSGGTLDSSSARGEGGDITLKAFDSITTGDITSGGGQIEIISSGSYPWGSIDTSGAGSIDTSGAGSIDTSGAGSIDTSGAGSIDTSGGTLDSSSDQGEGGDITLKAFGSITTGDIISDGGNINFTGDITSDGDNINFEDLPLFSIDFTGAPAELFPPNGQIIAVSDTIDTSGGTLDSTSDTGKGGDITLPAANKITIRDIKSNGGQLTLASKRAESPLLLSIISETDFDGGIIELEANGDQITFAATVDEIVLDAEANGNQLTIVSTVGDGQVGANGEQLVVGSTIDIPEGSLSPSSPVRIAFGKGVIPIPGVAVPYPPEPPPLVALRSPVVKPPSVAPPDPTPTPTPTPTPSAPSSLETPPNLEVIDRRQEEELPIIEKEQLLTILARDIEDCLAEEQLLGRSQELPLPGVFGDYAEAIDCFQKNLDFARKFGEQSREAGALYNLGVVYYALGDYAKAIDYHQQSLTIAESRQNPLERGRALNGLGTAYGAVGNYDRAAEYYQQSLELAKSIDKPQLEGNILSNLGLVYHAQKNYDKAMESQQQSLELARQLQTLHGERRALGNLGWTYYALTDYAKAIELEQQSLALARELKEPIGEERALENLGLAHYALEDYTKAVDYHRQSLALARQIGDRHAEGRALTNLGDALSKAGRCCSKTSNFG